ncbi:unnamed protein product, partial [marine sediment metagenome]
RERESYGNLSSPPDSSTCSTSAQLSQYPDQD